jgi:EAL domain-containing protein (putative c-di-GMP-specific phosphodiesterase class I)
VVDADRTARSFTCRVLANLGASQVDEADGVEAALARLEDAQSVPEVLLCDLRMEPVDGIQFIRHLGERGVRASLLLTADTDEHLLNAAQHLARIQGLTVLGGVRKPVTPAALSAVLARLDLVAPPGAEEGRERAQGTGLTIDSLRAGITGGAMELEYLPMVSLRERELLGAEALVRWRDAEGRTLDAATLVQEVEAAGLGDAFTERVLHMALSQAGAWHASGLPCGVSVNMFASSLGRLDLPEYLMDVSGQEGVTPGDVTLEVNELRFQRHREVPLEVLTRLRLRGVGIALDDFGTGSLGLDRLRHIPFTALKVDRDFVATAIRERTSRAILESSVSLARRLGMRAVAEGVVDAVTFRLVRDLGFDAAQGYGICPPIPGDRLADWSRDWMIGRTTGAAQDLLASA